MLPFGIFFAHMTLLMAFIANAALVLVGHIIPYNFFSILASEPCSWRGGHL
jgi:hypothetical protein